MGYVELVLGGDAMLGRLFNDRLSVVSPHHVWGNAIRSWRNSDLFIVNLETTITDSTKATTKTFNYKLSPQFADVLSAGKIGFASLANNHILDFGIEGLNDTVSILNSMKIGHAGAGTLGRARQPAIINFKNTSIAFISAADHYAHWAATPTQPGIWYVDIENRDWDHVLHNVHNLKRVADIVIVSLHWGPNWQELVDNNRQIFARKLVKAGADIIHGHSPHHLQKAERIGNSIVFYSLGGLIDDYAVDENFRSNVGAVAKIIVGGRAGIYDVKMIPTKITDMQVNLAVGDDAAFALNVLNV